MIKRLLLLSGLALTLAACGVDTTGLSADSSRTVAGNPSAAVVVTEFADLQCPACRSAYTMLEKPLLEKYGNQIAFEFKHFPLQTIHQYALELAMASECAADQGKFWEFVDIAFTQQTELAALGKNAAETWAGTLGIDMELFNRCLASRIKKDTVLADYNGGREIGVAGTPTFFVNGVQTEATMEKLSAAIDAELAKGAGRF